MDAQQVIEQCENKNFKQEDVALSYARLIAEKPTAQQISAANEAIKKRWPRGLRRVKEMAWKMIEVKR